MNLGHVIERNSACFGDQAAVVFRGETTTHRQFRNRVVSLINALVTRGHGCRDRIAVISQNRTEYLECYGAAELGGFVAVGINYRLSVAEQLAILQDCDPSVILFEEQYADRVAEIKNSLSIDTHYICFGFGPDLPWADAYEAVVGAAPSVSPKIRAKDNDLVYLIYTSGSTGRPKGVMLSNGGQYAQAAMSAHAHASQQDDRVEIVMPLYHIGGLAEHHAYSFAGATIFLHQSFHPVDVLMAIAEHRSTAVHLAPIMVQAIVEAFDSTPVDLSSLRTVIYASAPMSTALLKRALAVFGPVFMQVYGMTEGLISALLRHQHADDGNAEGAGHLASAGQPVLGVEVQIKGPGGQKLPDNAVGEICVKSGALFSGYWNRQEASDAALANGWFNTGDIGYLDDRHFLFIVDRKKDMIVSGGENIYSREVEEAIMHHPMVKEAAVIGVPDDKWGESVKAFVALNPDCTVSESDVIEHCRHFIASYKKPRTVEFISSLPRLASTNKVDKAALRERFWAGRDRRIS